MKKFISLLLSLSVFFSLALPVTAVEMEEDLNTSQAALTAEDYASAIKIVSMQYFPSFEGIGFPKASSAFSTSEQSDVPMITGVLPTTEDIDTYEVEIDHSILPQVFLYAFCYGATGDVTVTVNNSEGKRVIWTTLTNRSIDGFAGYRPKNYISFSDSTGAVKTYTITVTTDTGNAAYAINLGTKETFVESFGGTNITTIAKSVPTTQQAATLTKSCCLGTTSLLETGERFHYRADGSTYITATLLNHNTLAFTVLDPETGKVVYQTRSEDCGKINDTGAYFLGYVTARLDLERGKDYVIRFYTTAPIKADAQEYYQIHIGDPYYYWEQVDFKSSSSYSVSANAQRTFRFNISGFPSSARAERTMIAFNASSSVNNAAITSCVITAPNGKQCVATAFGRYSGNFSFDPLDYFGSSNTPLNGQWTVTIKTSKALSGLQFKIMSHYIRIVGKPGD